MLTTGSRTARYSTTTIVWLIATAIALIASVLRVHTYPSEDSALFEYVGRAMVHGEHLYTDIWDNKLPSIYLINALWQLLFGNHFLLHKIAEVAVNALSVALFGAVLRVTGVTNWAPAVCALAWILAVGTILDAAEYYALPCILLAYVLALSRRSTVVAGIAIAVATSFWIPSLLLLVPLLVENPNTRARASLLGGFLIAVIVYAAAMIAICGAGTIAELVRSWFSYVTFTRSNERPLAVRAASGLIISGVGILLIAFALVVRKPVTKQQQFALWWSGSALAGAIGPLNFYPHYFVPSFPALIFAIASFGFEWRVMRLRLVVAAVVVVFASKFTLDRMKSSSNVHSDTATVAVGDRIRQAFGAGSVIFSPDYAPEIYLAADAALTDRFALAGPANVGFMKTHHDPNSRTPVAILELSRNHALNDVRAPYVQVCTQRPLPTWTVYVTSAAASRFDCG